MNDKPQRTGLRNAWEIPEFASAKQILSRNRLNRMVRRLNALINLKSVPDAQCGDILMSDANAILPVAGGTGGGIGPGMNYRGTYVSTNSYSPGDVVRVQSGSSQGVWVCVTAVAASGTAPTYPESGSPPWEMLAFGVGTYHYKDAADCSAKKVDTNMGVPTTDP